MPLKVQVEFYKTDNDLKITPKLPKSEETEGKREISLEDICQLRKIM